MENQTKMRIHVGGLGETVKEEELRTTFSKSGTVEAVEIIRTKGRSFAYIDFLPSSDKSVAKLFSTYNGCAWKGGKLRLEKAREHYLERLKREWADDADLSSKTHDNNANDSITSVEHEEALDESSQIHMYLPRFRKVKSLPYKGTGKHKYSFQRYQASAFPVHFCDCPEHAVSINTIKEKQICCTSMEDGGMNQNEINLMNSVLNKFLEREPRSSASCNTSQANAEPEVTPSNHLPDDNSTDDDDNIIINAVAGPSDMTHLLENMKKQTGLKTKIARSKKLQRSAGVHSRKLSTDDNIIINAVSGPDDMTCLLENMKQTRSHPKMSRSKKPQRSAGAQVRNINRKSTENMLQQRGQVVFNGDSKSVSDSNVVKHGKADPEHPPPEQLNEATNTNPKTLTSDKPANATYSQKSSWMQLVSSASNSSFSISQILPETEVSKKSTQSSGGHRNANNYFGNNSTLKRKREDASEGLDSGKEDINIQGLRKKRYKSNIQRNADPAIC